MRVTSVKMSSQFTWKGESIDFSLAGEIQTNHDLIEPFTSLTRLLCAFIPIKKEKTNIRVGDWNNKPWGAHTEPNRRSFYSVWRTDRWISIQTSFLALNKLVYQKRQSIKVTSRVENKCSFIFVCWVLNLINISSIVFSVFCVYL